MANQFYSVLFELNTNSLWKGATQGNAALLTQTTRFENETRVC